MHTITEDILTPVRTNSIYKYIDSLSHLEMAYIWRFAPDGAPMLCGEVGIYFENRFYSLGGMTAAISKQLGLGPVR